MNNLSENELRELIVEIGRRMYEKSIVAANDGNISARLDEQLLLTTPTGLSKGFLKKGDVVVVDLEGNIKGTGKPSTELPMHLFIYNERDDVNAVVHAHPPYATAFATAGLALDKCILAEIVVTIGSIPLAEYGTPSTEELPNSLRPFIHSCDAFLLANHGVATVGGDLMNAYFKMERVEHYAKIVFFARALGGEKILSQENVHRLYQLREKYGATDLNPGCHTCNDECIEEKCINFPVRHDPDGPDFVNEIVEKVLQAVR